MLPILLPARAVGSILCGLRLRLSVFGLLGSGEGSAGRAVHASHVTRKPPCQPTTSAVLRRPSLLHPFRPRPIAFSPAPYKKRPCPSRCRRLFATQSTRRQLTATIGSNRPHDGIVCAAQPPRCIKAPRWGYGSAVKALALPRPPPQSIFNRLRPIGGERSNLVLLHLPSSPTSRAPSGLVGQKAIPCEVYGESPPASRGRAVEHL